jgi:hypothetical protein
MKVSKKVDSIQKPGRSHFVQQKSIYVQKPGHLAGFLVFRDLFSYTDVSWAFLT